METYGPNAATGTVSITVSGTPVEGPKMVLSPHSSIGLNVNEDFLSKEWNGTATWSDGKRAFELHGPRLYLQASVDPVGDLDLQGERSIRPPTGPKDDALVIEDVAPGRYRLRLTSARGYAASATAGGVDLLHEPLAVSAGSTPTVDITLRDDFAEIDGALTNVNGPLNAPATFGLGVHTGFWRPSAYIYFVPGSEGTGQYPHAAVAVYYEDHSSGIGQVRQIRKDGANPASTPQCQIDAPVLQPRCQPGSHGRRGGNVNCDSPPRGGSKADWERTEEKVIDAKPLIIMRLP